MQNYFDGLRKQHFPPAVNYLSAHLTVFHALPGSMLQQIDSILAAKTAQHWPIEAQVTSVRSLGRGVAFGITCQRLDALRAALAEAWCDVLTPQDRNTWKPHVTVQNKVTAEAAKALLHMLALNFEPFVVEVQGLDLWHYDGGPWELARSYPFRDS